MMMRESGGETRSGGGKALLSSSLESSPSPSSYLGPSRNGYGWGVFALRSFCKGDIVEVAPMFLRVDLEEHRPKLLKETVLNNYHYEYWAWDGVLGRALQYDMISFGMTLYYNNQSPAPTSTRSDTGFGPTFGPNIEQRKVGKEPDLDSPDRAVSIVYFALRDIAAGEELLVDYGSGWFEERGIQEIVNDGPVLFVDASRKQSPNSVKVHQEMQHVAGRVTFGYHHQALRRVLECQHTTEEDDEESIPYRLATALAILPQQKACFGCVHARVALNAGETIEYGPLLLLPRKLAVSTLLEALVFDWNDCECIQHLPKKVFLQYQPDIEAAVSTMKEIDRDDSVILALAGSVSMMTRSHRNFESSSTHSPNAILQVEADPCNENGFCGRVVAMQRIEVGQLVVLGMNRRPIATDDIVQELCLTGQPFLPSTGD